MIIHNVPRAQLPPFTSNCRVWLKNFPAKGLSDCYLSEQRGAVFYDVADESGASKVGHLIRLPKPMSLLNVFPSSPGDPRKIARLKQPGHICYNIGALVENGLGPEAYDPDVLDTCIHTSDDVAIWEGACSPEAVSAIQELLRGCDRPLIILLAGDAGHRWFQHLLRVAGTEIANGHKHTCLIAGQGTQLAKVVKTWGVDHV